MEQKQTAVEWFANELAKKGLLVIRDYKNLIAYRQAKEMEKQQIMQAVYDAMGTNFDPNMGRAEQYYNKEYGNET